MKIKFALMRFVLARIVLMQFALCLCASFFLFTCKSITHAGPEFALPPRTVVFSFDDGPNIHDDTTARLLDILKKYEITAMFVLLGENAEEYPDLVRRMVSEGHYLVNHGYADKWASKMKEDEFRDNLAKGDAAISAAIGREFIPKLYRPHGGFYHAWQEKICTEAGYTIIPSDIRVYDAVTSKAKKDKVFKNTIKKTERQNGGIILLHDARGPYYTMEKELEKNPDGAFNRSWIPQTTEEVIIALLEKGYAIGSPELIIPKDL